MGLRKKAIIFSLMAVGFSSLFLILFSTYFQEKINPNAEAITTRIIDLDESIDKFFEFSKEATTLATKESLKSLYQAINQTGNYLPPNNFEKNLTQCAINSTGCNNTQNLETILQDYANKLKITNNAEYTFKINNLSITDETSFEYRLKTNLTLTLKDSFAEWNITKNVFSRLNLEGTPDPLWLQLAPNYYRIIKIKDLQDTDFNNITLLTFIQEGNYRSSTEAPCLSDRYEGNFNNQGGICGIESIIDQQDLSLSLSNAIPHIDYQAVIGTEYNCTSTDPVYDLGQPLNFLRLKQTDATRYGVEELLLNCQN